MKNDRMDGVRGANVARLLFVALAAVMCAGMWGCSEETFEWGERSHSRIVSFVDDSLVLLYNCRSYNVCHEGVGPLGYTDCGGGCENYGLFLANYRKKQSIYWGDTSNFVIAFMRGFYRDSMVIFLKNDYSEFGFWKIGEKPEIAKKMKWNSPCSGYDGYNFTRFRPWINGGVLLLGAKGCNYAVLDTSTGNVNELLTDGEYEWLEDCVDATYLDGNEICLKPIYEDDRYGVFLYENRIKTDSLVWENAKWSIETNKNIEILGNIFVLNHPTRMNNYSANPLSGKNLNAIDPLNPLNPVAKIDDYYSTFLDSAGVGFQYGPDDLKFEK